MFTVHDLTVLVAVADSGSVRQAAVELSRTQPAISQAIQRIEEDVGFTLLDRISYRAALTEKGMLFLKRARALVQQSRELKAYADTLHQDNESVLRVSVHGALSIESWMPLFNHLPQTFPDTVLEVRVEEGRTPTRQLVTGKADFAITVGAPTDVGVLDIERQKIGELEFVNTIATALVSSKLEDTLSALPQIIVADFNDPEPQYGVVEGHRYWRVSDFRVKAASIVDGLGWGSVPLWMVEDQLANGSLKRITYRGLGNLSSHSAYLCRRLQMPLGPVSESVWKYIQLADKN